MNGETLYDLAATMIEERQNSWVIEFNDGTRGYLPFTHGHVDMHGVPSAPLWLITKEGWPEAE